MIDKKKAFSSSTIEAFYQTSSNGDLSIFYPESDYIGKGIRLLKRTYPIPAENIYLPTLSEHLIAIHTRNSTHIEKQVAGGKKQGKTTHPGTFTFIPALCTSSWYWSTEIEFFLIYLSSSWLKKFALKTFNRTPQNIELIDRFAEEDYFLQQLVTALQNELASPYPINQLYIESLQNVIAIHLLRHHCQIKFDKLKLIKGTLSSQQQKQIISFIMANLDRKLDLAEISQQIEISTFHFCRLFKQTIGITPHQYVRQQRIERAKQLLKQKQKSIAEIALDCGFSSQSSFTTSFHQVVGITPKQYRLSQS